MRAVQQSHQTQHITQQRQQKADGKVLQARPNERVDRKSLFTIRKVASTTELFGIWKRILQKQHEERLRVGVHPTEEFLPRKTVASADTLQRG